MRSSDESDGRRETQMEVIGVMAVLMLIFVTVSRDEEGQVTRDE